MPCVLIDSIRLPPPKIIDAKPKRDAGVIVSEAKPALLVASVDILKVII